jgi:hypothetical protein
MEDSQWETVKRELIDALKSNDIHKVEKMIAEQPELLKEPMPEEAGR